MALRRQNRKKICGILFIFVIMAKWKEDLWDIGHFRDYGLGELLEFPLQKRKRETVPRFPFFIASVRMVLGSLGNWAQNCPITCQDGIPDNHQDYLDRRSTGVDRYGCIPRRAANHLREIPQNWKCKSPGAVWDHKGVLNACAREPSCNLERPSKLIWVMFIWLLLFGSACVQQSSQDPFCAAQLGNVSGLLNRLNAVLSLLHPLDRYRTPLR